jgi:multidrug resistance efflux pump
MTNAQNTSSDPALDGRADSEPASDRTASWRDRVQSLRLRTDGTVARPRSAWLPWGITVIALAATGVFGWRAYRLSPEDPAQPLTQRTEGSDKVTPTPGTAAAPAAASGDVVLDAKGYVVAAHQIQLSPQVGGEIIWLDPSFKEGAVYRKGDKLAEVDPVIYSALLKSAQAALRVAQTNLQQVQTGSTLNEIEAARAQVLNLSAKLELAQLDRRYNLASGIGVSRSELEKSMVQVKVDQAALEAQKQILARLEASLEEQRLVCQAQVQKAQADVEQAAKQLKNCTIVAPTTGIVLSKKAELGGYVNPMAFGAAGYLCEMADLRDLEVELDIQERDISRIKPGQRCRIVPESGQHDDAFLKTHANGYSGVVSRRMPVANRSKGAITVRVKVEIPPDEKSGEYLLPDMGVLVSFLKDAS